MSSQTGPDKSRKITLREVAEEAGVSLATASYVLNKQKSFSEETKNRVLRAAEKLQYRPNYSAQAVRTGKTKSIGLVLPNLQNPLFPEIAKAVENSAHQAGYSVILVDTQQNPKIEKESALRLIELGVDGIIWCPMGEQDSFVKQRKGIPIVILDRPATKSRYDHVCSDYAGGAELIADHTLKLGHTEIGLISGPQSLPSALLRSRRFKERVAGQAEIVWEVENRLTPELSEATTTALQRREVTLVIAGNDLVAIGVIMYLRSQGISVPEDVSVIGFDGTRLSDIVSPKLTTVKQPLVSLGQEAVNTLLQRIEHSAASPSSITLDVELIPGESAALLRN